MAGAPQRKKRLNDFEMILHLPDTKVGEWPVREIGEIVAGKSPGRLDRGSITLFKSSGVAMDDVALAARVMNVR